MTNATYFIPDANVARFLEAIKALAKRAAKLGCVAVSAVAVHALAVPYRRRIENDAGEIEYVDVLIPCTAYTVTGAAPVIEGWAIVATIEHEAGVNILRSISDEPLPQRFREVGPETCDHCGFVRNRKDTYVVRNVETGEYKQVGRSCLKDFLGNNKSPAAIAAYAQALMDFDTMVDGLCDEEEGGFGLGGKGWAYDLVDFLAATSAVIDSLGWVSRGMAYEHDHLTATADVVLDALDAAAKGKGDLFVSDANRAEAVEAIEWANAQDAAGNDYIYNLQAICELGYVTYRTAGYAASIVSSMRRSNERRLKVEIVKADGTDHIGTEGKRGEFTLTLLGTRYFESQWGETCLHRFADQDGNLVIWWASNEYVVPEGTVGHDGVNHSGKAAMVKGATYRVKATVKSHDEYKDQAQTVMTRVAVQPLVKVKKAS